MKTGPPKIAFENGSLVDRSHGTLLSGAFSESASGSWLASGWTEKTDKG